MRKIIILTTLFALICGVNAFSQCTVEVKGFVKFVNDNLKVTAYQKEGTDKITLAETPVAADHTFKLNVTTAKPGKVIIDYGHCQNVQVWVEDENMEIDFRGVDTAKIKVKNPPYVHIKAGKKNEVMNLINYELFRNYQNMIGISQAVYNSPIKDEKERHDFSFKLYDMNRENFKAHMSYIAEHYSDCTSIIAALQYLDIDKDAAVIDKALATIEANNPGTTLARDFRIKAKAKKEDRERMLEGNQAPDFSFPDAKGKMHSLKDFKGKIVLIDFWASWCGPCRKEIPNVKKYYEEYKGNKNIAFLSVSIDEKRSEWEKAMKEENMPWLQLLAPNKGKEIMDSYQFSIIPFIILIDQDGKIYKKNLRGEFIKDAIDQVLSGKKPVQPKTLK